MHVRISSLFSYRKQTLITLITTMTKAAAIISLLFTLGLVVAKAHALPSGNGNGRLSENMRGFHFLTQDPADCVNGLDARGFDLLPGSDRDALEVQAVEAYVSLFLIAYSRYHYAIHHVSLC